MRKVLLFTLPVCSVFILFLSFFLLESLASPSVLGAKTTSKKVVKKTIKISNYKAASPITSQLKSAPPTSTPTAIPTSTPTKAPTPTPTATSTPISTPEPTRASSQGVEGNFIMDAINAYRASNGLSKVSEDPLTCAFAKTRADEISSNFNHDGFTNRIHSHTLPYPSYHEITENIVMTPDYKQVVAIWINSPGHAENMRKDTPFVCVAKHGNYYAYEGLRI